MKDRLSQVTFITVFLILLQIVLTYIHAPFQQLNLFGTQHYVLLPALLPIRISTAFVFIWYALGHIASGLEFNGLGNKSLQKLGIQKQIDFTTTAKLWGVFEFLIALSFIFGFYLDVSSFFASFLLAAIIFIYYFANSSFLFRDVAILGAVLSLYLLAIS